VTKAQLLDRIEQRLREEAARGKRTLLVVDEAQNLPVSALEELRMLSNFTSQGRALIQIFLLGQPEFRDRVADDESLEQLRQRVIATHHLEAMEANEVEPYAVHRLAVAGWQGTARVRARRLRRPLPPLGRSAAQAEPARHAPPPLCGRGAARDDRRLRRRSRGGRHGRRPAGERVGAGPAAAAAGHGPGAAHEPFADASLERRIAAIESRLDEQEAAVRRVLTVLLDWVENESQPRRSNAA
jgi:hypothetical protein